MMRRVSSIIAVVVVVVVVVLCISEGLASDYDGNPVVESENSLALGESSLLEEFSRQFDALHLHRSTYSIATVQFMLSEDPGHDARSEKFIVWMKSDVCVGCKLMAVSSLSKKTTPQDATALIDTSWATTIRITTEDATYPNINNTYCELRYRFKQNWVYNLSIPTTIENGTECDLQIWSKALYENTAVLFFYGWIVSVFITMAVWVYCIRGCVMKRHTINHNGLPLPIDDRTPLADAENNQPTNKKSTRLKSVDTFRGFAMAILAGGDAGDGHYWFQMHSVYYGISIADIMFPFFIFVMGTSIHLSFNILLSKGHSYWSIFKKLVFRSVALFVMGVCIQSNNDLRTLRIPGVLQRFGITYFIVASSYLLSRRLLARRKESTSKYYMMFRDVIDYLELPLAVCCIAINVLLTFFLPVPGCPLGYQGPGGPLVGENGELTNCTGGAAGYIDRMFFTPAHIMPSTKATKVYHTTVPYDPEGILGTFTSIALCVFGLQAGKILHLFSTVRGRVVRLVLWGLALIACCAVLSKCHMADGWIPVNKTLWSVSFIALTGGLAFMFQAIFHVAIDVTHFWNGAPLIYLGMNSILIYIGVDIMSQFLPFSWTPLVGNHTEYIILSMWSIVLWHIIAYYLYRKKMFFKL